MRELNFFIYQLDPLSWMDATGQIISAL